MAIAVAVAVAGLAGCGGTKDASDTPDAPVLTVVTGLWPLAQAALEIGQANVHVVDVAPAEQDPLDLRLTSTQTAQVRRAGLVLEVGGGLQPSLAVAAKTTKAVSQSGDPSGRYVWLNPYDMEGVANAVGKAMEAADPKAVRTFSNGLADFQAELSSLDADYQSTLSSCPDTKLVTVDNAFSVLSPRYPVTDDAVGPPDPTPVPTTATVKTEVAAIKATGAHEVYDESWVPESSIIEASSIAGVDVGQIDTLLGEPPGGWHGQATYFGQMEQILSVLSSALNCPNPETE